MDVTPQKIPSVLLIKPKVFGDPRGFFFESWHKERYAEAGLPRDFVQDNLSFSQKGILRGLHLQHPYAQGKLVNVLQGEVFDVAVDVRVGSPTFGQSVGVHLSAENKLQLFIPPGFAHGFAVLSDTALFCYKCTELYHPETEISVLWNDPALGIAWPFDASVTPPLLSAKDQKGLLLADIPHERLPQYQAKP